MDKLFEIKNLRCSYDKPFVEGQSKIVLEINHLDIPRGKKVFIVGESGIGKSTILEVIGMMNNTVVSSADSVFNYYEKDGDRVDLLEMWMRNKDSELSEFRLKHFNFIFQSTNLMRNFTAYENIAITRLLQGYPLEDTFQKVESVLADLGILGLGRERNAQDLSGGQQQRIAFARAILPDFTVLFGDEPTGNLDGENAMKAMETLSRKLNDIPGSSAIIVSHDMHLATLFADIVIKVRRKDEHGYIDESSVFLFDAKSGQWSNGEVGFAPADFESYLRKKL
jgi:ABC-type lipoprotein export system ATPase subunit